MLYLSYVMLCWVIVNCRDHNFLMIKTWVGCYQKLNLYQSGHKSDEHVYVYIYIYMKKELYVVTYAVTCPKFNAGLANIVWLNASVTTDTLLQQYIPKFSWFTFFNIPSCQDWEISGKRNQIINLILIEKLFLPHWSCRSYEIFSLSIQCNCI